MKIAKYEITSIDDPFQDGFSFAIFVSGCKRMCPGCQNPELQDFSYGQIKSITEIKKMIEERRNLISSISYVGGDWMYFRKNYKKIALFCKRLGLRNILYTGFRFENLEPAIVRISDVIIDGEYMQELDSLGEFPASRNQRVFIKGEELDFERIIELPINKKENKC